MTGLPHVLPLRLFQYSALDTFLVLRGSRMLFPVGDFPRSFARKTPLSGFFTPLSLGRPPPLPPPGVPPFQQLRLLTPFCRKRRERKCSFYSFDQNSMPLFALLVLDFSSFASPVPSIQSENAFPFPTPFYAIPFFISRRRCLPFSLTAALRREPACFP